MAQTLRILEQFDLSELEHGSAEHLRLVAEAIAYAYADKRAHVGDPEHVDVPLDVLVSREHAADYARRIERGEQATLMRLDSLDEPPETSQVCTLDEHGNAVSMTHTLGAPSGVITPGSGFILNGCMGIFDPRPGHATSIAPGKAYTSSMSPSIVFDPHGALRLVIGAPGATYIPQAIAQVISNVIDFHMSISDAVIAPRIAVTRSRTVDVSNRIPRFVTAEIESMGYAIQRSYLSYAFAGVHAVETVDGRWRGGADPGRDGMALVV